MSCIFQILNVKYKKDHSIFDLRISKPSSQIIKLKKIKLNLIGKFNVLNSVAAISLCLHLGIKSNIIKNSLKRFSGIQRRLTKVYKIGKREFYDDYAHHPTEIKSVIQKKQHLNGTVPVIILTEEAQEINFCNALDVKSKKYNKLIKFPLYLCYALLVQKCLELVLFLLQTVQRVLF